MEFVERPLVEVLLLGAGLGRCANLRAFTATVEVSGAQGKYA